MAYIGQIIGGKYRISSFIDKGGMSEVYRAVDESRGEEWAVKEIPRFLNGADNSLHVAAAMKEANIIQKLDHPSVVRIVEIISDERAVYIVEDLIHGRSLGDIARTGQKVTEADLLNWAERICDVLEYLHHCDPKIIYRDTKPDHIILTDSGEIKLIDFGIARQFKPGEKQDTQYLGSVQFAAPEQFEDFGMQTDERTDIYGFGCTIRYMENACCEISSDFSRVIRRCIQLMPKDRYQNVGQLRKDLKKVSVNRKQKFIRDLLPVCAVAIMVIALLISSVLLKGSEAVIRDPQEMSGKNAESTELLCLLDRIYEGVLRSDDLNQKGGAGKQQLLKKIEDTYVAFRQVYEEDGLWKEK